MLLTLSKYIFVNTYWKKNDFDTNGKKKMKDWKMVKDKEYD